MYKSLVAFGCAAATLTGCAGTAPRARAAAEDCRMVAQDNTDSHIKVRQQCDTLGATPSSAEADGATAG